MKKKLSILWFVLGLGSSLQVVFSLSISEFLVVLLAPFIIASEISHMRRTGVMTFFWMAVLLFCGCIVSLVANHAEFYQVIRGVSITGLIICSVVVGHYMLRNCPQGLKWYFIGAMLSGFICIFIFQRTVEVVSVGGDDVDSIMSGPLFWIQRLSSLLITPVLAFYLKLPLAYSIGAPLFMFFFSVLYSASGRAAALSFIGSAALVMIGRKKRKSMAALGRHFTLIFCLAVIGVYAAKAGYQWAALNNYLGEKARAKYEHQTAGGSGIVKLLIGGRADAFVGLLAVADSPIIGKGYWALDTEGYYEEFLAKYGNPDDYEQYIKNKLYYASNGYATQKLIACHSHITSFWVWYGLPGLLFWLYVIYVIFRFLRHDVAVVPQWYYWLAAGVPGLLWHICFSPFNNRIGLPLLVVGMLLARAIRFGRYQLPKSMIMEIEESERK